MATVAEFISQVDKIRPNQYDTAQKTKWLSEVEGTLVDEVLNMADEKQIEFFSYDYIHDAEKELLLPERFSDIYSFYLLAKIDFHDAETESYNNDVIMYQAAYDQFAAWYRRNHIPKSTAYFRGF